MIYTIFLTVGLILFSIAMYLFQRSLSFMKTGFRTEATIISFKKSRGSKGGTLYTPIYQFTTETGQAIEYSDNVASSNPDGNVNDQVPLVYDRDNPNKAMILSYWGAFRATVILLAIGMPFVVIGGGYFASKVFLCRRRYLLYRFTRASGDASPGNARRGEMLLNDSPGRASPTL